MSLKGVCWNWNCRYLHKFFVVLGLNSKKRNDIGVLSGNARVQEKKEGEMTGLGVEIYEEPGIH